MSERRVLAAAYLFVAILFLVVGLQQANEPYLIDEAEFPFVSAAVAETGRPVYYHGEFRPTDVGVWHPPGYVYALGAWIAVLGDSHMAVRGFGLAMTLVTAVLVVLLLRTVRPRAPDFFGPVVFGTYLIHPFVLQSALVPDIDGTIGVLALAAGLLVAARVSVAPVRESWHVPVIAAVLAFALWTKLTTPLALMPILILALRPAAGPWWRWGRDSVFAIGGGVVLFAGTWWLFAQLAGLEFRFPFDFTTSSFNKGGAGSLTLATVIDRLRPMRTLVFWIGPVFGGLAIAGAFWAFTQWRSAEDRATRLVALFAIGVVGFYDVIAGAPFGFPKYWIAAMPALAVLAAIVVIDAVAAAGAVAIRWKGQLGWVALGVAAFCILGLVGLAETRLVRAVPGAIGYQPLPGPILIASLWIAAFCILIALLRVAPRPAALVALGAVAALGTAVLLSTATTFMQRSAPYSVRYHYGERGFEQAIADVREWTNPGESIIGPKDIGFEADRPFFEDALVFGDPPKLARLLDSGNVALVVTRCVWDYSESVWPDAFATIRGGAVPVVADLGSDYVLWVPRASASGIKSVESDALCRD